jgi:hypothetical protein
MTKWANNLDQLFKMINDDIMEVMDESVAPKMKEIESEHVQTDVYNAYTGQDPYMRRRGTNGGLADTDNMVHTVTRTTNGYELWIKNITRGNPRVWRTGATNEPNYLAGIIENGRDRGRYMDNKTFTQDQYLSPRPFISNSIREIERTLAHVEEMHKGLKRKGYDVYRK